MLFRVEFVPSLAPQDVMFHFDFGEWLIRSFFQSFYAGLGLDFEVKNICIDDCRKTQNYSKQILEASLDSSLIYNLKNNKSNLIIFQN